MNLFVETIQMYSLKELMQNAILICHSIVIYYIILYCICKKNMFVIIKLLMELLNMYMYKNMLFCIFISDC